ncbi:MAG TPA: dihydrodipicolinate synthase family protein [Anaerolineales bacterium]|nr:dihydrodipicolinate synthase family protein [Anaerolineales bacterium]
MMTHELSGVYAAALTPLKKDLSPDEKMIPIYLDHLENNGCHGALLLGTTGEGPSFSRADRRKVMEAGKVYKQSHPRFQMLVGTGTSSLDETTELTELAFSMGFNGVVVLPPYYYRKLSEQSLFEWYRAIIEKAVPADGYLFVYNIPAMTGISFPPNLLANLKERYQHQFAGIKDSSSDEHYCRELGDRFGKELLVLNGNDRLFSMALNNEAGGCITALANLYSQLLREIWDGFQNSINVESTQRKLSSLRTLLEAYAPYAATLKAMMNKMYGYPMSPVKPPLENLSHNQVVDIFDQFKTITRSFE